MKEEEFTSKGIPVKEETLPSPVSYGNIQFCIISVPHPNEPFFFAIVAEDSAGNRSPVSNIISIYIHKEEPQTTIDTNFHPLLLLEMLRSENSSDLENILSSLHDKEQSNNAIYIAGGAISGVVSVIVIVLVILMISNKRTVSKEEKPSTFPVSEIQVRESKSESPTIVHGSKLSLDGSSKVLLSWLESLPPAQQALHVPDNGCYEASFPTSPHHSFTRSPRRHRMLTNGSFLTAMDVGPGSDYDSTQITVSTLDDSQSSDSSHEFYQNYSTQTGGVRRSNTSATLSRLSSKKTLFKEYEGSVSSASIGRLSSKHDNRSYYTSSTLGRLNNRADNKSDRYSATLGRRPKRSYRDLRKHEIDRSFLPAVSETNLYYNSKPRRGLRRTESFV